MKAYEILPAGMTDSAVGGGAKEPKPHEILPEAGVAAQGLVGWTKAASSIARGAATHVAFSKQAIGLPYDPAGTVPTKGGATVSRTGKMYEILPAGMTRRAKESKLYEIVPGSKTASQGLGGTSGGCGCGGKCGDRTGHDHHPSGMKKSGGCGCGGKCGGTAGGALLPPSTGIMLLPSSTDMKLPPSWTPSGGGPAGGAGIARVFAPFFDPRAGLDVASSALWLSCGELEDMIDKLIARIHFLETAPPPLRGACGECVVGMNCAHPCDAFDDYDAITQCMCTRLAMGLDSGRTRGASISCPLSHPDNQDPERQWEIRRNYYDLCHRDELLPQLLDQLHKLLEQLNRQGCPGQPPPPPGRPPRPQVDCSRHPEICHEIYCRDPRHRWEESCWRLPGFFFFDPRQGQPPPPPMLPHDPGPADCNRILTDYNGMRELYLAALDIYGRLLELSARFLIPLPHVPPTCTSSPACAGLDTLRNTLVSELIGWSSAPTGASLALPLGYVRRYILLLEGLITPCRLDLLPEGMMREAARRVGCSDPFNTSLWSRAGGWMSTLINDVRIYVEGLRQNADLVLRSLAGDLSSIGCRIPDPLPPISR